MCLRTRQGTDYYYFCVFVRAKWDLCGKLIGFCCGTFYDVGGTCAGFGQDSSSRSSAPRGGHRCCQHSRRIALQQLHIGFECDYVRNLCLRSFKGCSRGGKLCRTGKPWTYGQSAKNLFGFSRPGDASKDECGAVGGVFHAT